MGCQASQIEDTKKTNKKLYSSKSPIVENLSEKAK